MSGFLIAVLTWVFFGMFCLASASFNLQAHPAVQWLIIGGIFIALVSVSAWMDKGKSYKRYVQKIEK